MISVSLGEFSFHCTFLSFCLFPSRSLFLCCSLSPSFSAYQTSPPLLTLGQDLYHTLLPALHYLQLFLHLHSAIVVILHICIPHPTLVYLPWLLLCCLEHPRFRYLLPFTKTTLYCACVRFRPFTAHITCRWLPALPPATCFPPLLALPALLIPFVATVSLPVRYALRSMPSTPYCCSTVRAVALTFSGGACMPQFGSAPVHLQAATHVTATFCVFYTTVATFRLV